MPTAKLIFPHQLFKEQPLDVIEGQYFIIEEHLYFKEFNFHQQKIAFHRASMKAFEAHLNQNGKNVQYIDSKEAISDIRLLLPHLKNNGYDAISIIDPVDDWLLRRISKACSTLNLGLQIIDSPLFLNTPSSLETFFKPNKKKFFQTEFYKQQRISKALLLSKNGAPLGGKWSFDEENRKKFPKNKQIPPILFPKENPFTKEAKHYTQTYFSNNIGRLNPSFTYPTTFEESEQWLNDFLETRFQEFGDYEDAIVRNASILNHSVLTPMLNVGLLTPQQILDKTIAFAFENNIPINSLEGFVRQIIGWREFIRGVYITKGRQERTTNFWGFTRKIPASFYDGTTGILPIDETIQKVLSTGYCHHIERLMVLGNFILLCEFDPDEVYRWFMELFIDAYDWVMVPNVYGMSQFADGGILSTKPYISGSNYLMKMSDYPKGEWQEIWDALFWRFMDKQRAFFLGNPRLGMLIRTYDKWDATKQETIHQKAEAFLSQLVKA
ncbi:MAG: cryptochrome/photolyase family protein [Fluviicola sp.]|nr:cryptochrome/photolyase family protein [Fluviicola sp.]